ncbi:rhomboid family intramembrane serine protease [Deinococcus pimensis]|uniref:rhomboid family intramembrane serine protease n=1 Tax=Deinococcus pimensis TaxID=309888 RepID=UPI000481E4E5|nr:rhomboid family intramembrane serine protease [Deinococcus pimensis]
MFPLYDDNRTGRVPWVTRLLIVLNVLVFIYQSSLTQPQLDALVTNYGFVPARLSVDLPGAILAMFTSQFLHGSLWHLLGNMWFLFVFADNVEDRFGHLPFLLLYLAWGVVAALAQAFFGGDPSVPMVGASGAISGVLGAYLVTYPQARIRTFLPIFVIFLLPWVPAIVYLPYWFFLQVLSLQGGESNVAVMAHIGGFVVGVLLCLVIPRPRPTSLR